MKIAYVAKHQRGGNDDEGAITHALRALDHRVYCVPEELGKMVLQLVPDLVLFHKWQDVDTLRQVRCPKVFWWFDLVSATDRMLVSRCTPRVQWMQRIVPYVDAGFLSDGDFVRSSHSSKLHWLTQGADERYVGLHEPFPLSLESEASGTLPLLFLGTEKGGTKRAAFLRHMQSTYGSSFTHIREGVHGEPLRRLIAESQVVVCPSGYVTPHYWSNRVYLMLGYGACVLHPYCEDLTQHYAHDRHLTYYTDLENLDSKVQYLLDHPEERVRMKMEGLAHTRAYHTYRHRCVELLETLYYHRVL